MAREKDEGSSTYEVADGLYISRGAFKGGYNYFSEDHEAGREGKDNSVSGRMLDIVSDVVTGNAGDRTQTQDKAASDWDAGYNAGNRDDEDSSWQK